MDKCWYSMQGSYMELPGVSGQVVCRAPAPLCSDIMGTFRFSLLSVSTAFSVWQHFKHTGSFVGRLEKAVYPHWMANAKLNRS